MSICQTKTMLKAKLSTIEIQIVDVAHYHGKVEELLKVVGKFSPSTLIIDWCHNYILWQNWWGKQEIVLWSQVDLCLLQYNLWIRGWGDICFNIFTTSDVSFPTQVVVLMGNVIDPEHVTRARKRSVFVTWPTLK